MGIRAPGSPARRWWCFRTPRQSRISCRPGSPRATWRWTALSRRWTRVRLRRRTPRTRPCGCGRRTARGRCRGNGGSDGCTRGTTGLKKELVVFYQQKLRDLLVRFTWEVGKGKKYEYTFQKIAEAGSIQKTNLLATQDLWWRKKARKSISVNMARSGTWR